MKSYRHMVPLLGILALLALFLKLPEVPVFGFLKCKKCLSNDPYFPLIGAGYFATLVAISLLFPAFPNPQVARGGLIWSVLLALTLTFIHLPLWCIACLIAHACNISIWMIWMVRPSERESSVAPLKERLCLALFVPISVVALFSCLNLTFMAYGVRSDLPTSITSLQIGDAVPNFTTKTIAGCPFVETDGLQKKEIVINFVAPDCPYCQEQLPLFNSVATQMSGSDCRFINVSPIVNQKLMQESPSTEWVEDKEGQLRQLFKVAGYPTMFVIGIDGKITHIVSGLIERFKDNLITYLSNSKSNKEGTL